jgi:hypothetical protein
MPRSIRRPVEDFDSVFHAISKQTKEPIILVGGHAVNAWALAYADRIGHALKPYQPLTSGDMDVVATRNGLFALHRDLGGKLLLSGPREITDGTLILGVEPDSREVDVLRSLNGVPKVRWQDSVVLQVCGYSVPVLFPHLLLQGKLQNALHLDQTNRQDIKHVRILRLVLGEFLVEAVKTASPSNEKAALSLLQTNLTVLTSENAQEFEERFRDPPFVNAMPIEALRDSALPKLTNFGRKQLTRQLALTAKNRAKP